MQQEQRPAPLELFSRQAAATSLAGIELFTAPMALLGSIQDAAVLNTNIFYVLKQNIERFLDDLRQGLAYSSELQEEVTGVQGTGSKRVASPMDKLPKFAYSAAAAALVCWMLNDISQTALKKAAEKAKLEGHKPSIQAINHEASAIVGKLASQPSRSKTLQQTFFTVSNTCEAQYFASAQEQDLLAGKQIEARKIDGMFGARIQKISTAQALLHYFQAHPEDYKEALCALLGLTDLEFEDSQLVRQKILAALGKSGRIAFAEQVFSALAKRKKKQGRLSQFLSSFSIHFDKKSKTAFVCMRKGPKSQKRPPRRAAGRPRQSQKGLLTKKVKA
ncbi:hypothetical protein FJZ26_00245 [Candidatus Parvarchaeota archaeon]|nr:hypothetical protein [Candidatus Parvarchaeota archaeon]